MQEDELEQVLCLRKAQQREAVVGKSANEGNSKEVQKKTFVDTRRIVTAHRFEKRRRLRYSAFNSEPS